METSTILMNVYVLRTAELAIDIVIRQYRCMSKSLLVRAPAETAACCPPLSVQPLSQAQAEQIAPLLKALADPVRLRLMSLVASHPGSEACVCDLNEAFDLSQPTISHHLKVLHEAGLLDRDKRGVWVYYRARPEALASLGTLIGSPDAAAYPLPGAGS
jgi:ArsR family transcriptional regulator, arsenate/arsenite/antimonite-responsive transcriptional repressor